MNLILQQTTTEKEFTWKIKFLKGCNSAYYNNISTRKKHLTIAGLQAVQEQSG